MTAELYKLHKKLESTKLCSDVYSLAGISLPQLLRSEKLTRQLSSLVVSQIEKHIDQSTVNER